MSEFERLLEDLKRDEGTKKIGAMFVPYKCPAGKWTIGWGHNLEAWGIPVSLVDGILSGFGITEAQAYSLLYTDAVSSEQAAKLCIGVAWSKLSPIRQNVLTNMCFNLGVTKFVEFTQTILAVRRLDYYEAAAQMTKSGWYTQTGARSKRLVGEMLTGTRI